MGTLPGGWDLITLRGSERLAYQRAKETLAPLGAVYGQIAGAYYGESGIPKDWLTKRNA